MIKSLVILPLLLVSTLAQAQGRITALAVTRPATRPVAAPNIDPLSLTSEAPVSRSTLVAMNPGPRSRTARMANPARLRGNQVAVGGPIRGKNLIAQTVTAPAPVADAPSRRVRPEPAPTRDFSALVSLGLDMRGERDQAQSTIPRSWPTLTLGVGMKPWMALLEYASFSENSGNNALNVQRKVETLLLWGHWSPDEDWIVQPYMGIGFGGYRTSAEMTLYSQRQGAQGKWIEHGAGALGLRLAKLSPFLLAVEGRVHMNRELDPSPTLSGMLKIGFILE